MIALIEGSSVLFFISDYRSKGITAVYLICVTEIPSGLYHRVSPRPAL